jgi:hypothetical protein
MRSSTETFAFTHISLPDLLQFLVIADSGTFAQRMESENGKNNA